ncbi:Transcriptional regulator MtlR [Anaerolineales bacterium]|nr:Transcriptional regulator MtlR [Anaerolineales bacterium]
MLPALTNRQRDILKILLEASKPISSVELAGLLHLSPHQVIYSMPAVREWLKQHNEDLYIHSGIGFSTTVSRKQALALQQEIDVNASTQLVLSISQRQQLLALFLLTRPGPFILSQLEKILQVSRMTVSKDLDEVEVWFLGEQITLTRKPHFGIQAVCTESSRRQTIAKLIWGETPFSKDPITEVTHADGLVFDLKGYVRLLPILEYINTFLSQINIRRTVGLVTKAEEQLGGRFTDDAVLNLALIFAIMANRVQGGHHLGIDKQLVSELETMPIWPVAGFVAQRLGQTSNSSWKSEDIAGIAMELLSAQRNEILPGELVQSQGFNLDIRRIMDYLGEAFNISKLKHDQTLQNGLLNNIIPACFRQRFNLWFPDSLTKVEMPEQPERELGIAQGIVNIVRENTGVVLGENDLNILAMLLRAAYIRNRSYLEHVIVVCPSGMATAQLLVARLGVRFPYLNSLEVVSMRDLTSAMVLSADLILTTVPLPRQYAGNPKVIRVHPLLMPEDIEAITKFLSYRE